MLDSDFRAKVIDNYIFGYNCKEIAFKLRKNCETIRKIMRDYKSSLSENEQRQLLKIHKRFREERFGETIKFNRRLKRKYMRTAKAIQTNKSAYKMNKSNTRQIYNKEVGAKPSDLPYYF